MTRLLKNIFLLIILQFCSFSVLFSQNKIGLQFNSFEVIPEERTGLNLTPSKAFTFSEGFSMSFDVRFLSDLNFNYGHIFRIVSRDQHYIDFLIKGRNLKVAYSLGEIILDCTFDEVGFHYDDFLHFDIKLDTKNQLLTITIGDQIFSTKEIAFEEFKKVCIYFGKCDDCQPQVIDIPKVIIKEIRINDLNNKPIYYWPLSKHTSTGVYDELKKHFARTENPHWFLDEHAFWKKTVSFSTRRNPQVTYNLKEKQLVIFDKDKLFSYDIDSQTLTEEKLQAGIINRVYTNQTIYNPLTESYYFYVDPDKDVFSYDPEVKKWLDNSVWSTRNNYSHHNKLISPIDSSLYIFGGYGHHLFQNEINKYDFRTQKWEQLFFQGDSISPRYLSGLGKKNDSEILIFGGYGSESGRQELYAQYYYDLYSVDMNTMTTKKIWELPFVETDFVVGNSLVVDTLNNRFYALCFPRQLYNTSIFIAEFSLEKPEYRILADSIPFNFQDTYSYADLFLTEEKDELLAVTYSSTRTDSITTVSVHSLAYPPLTEAELYQDVEESRFGFFLFILVSIFILFFVFAYVIYRKKQEKHQLAKQNGSDFQLEKDIELPTVSPEKVNLFDERPILPKSEVLFFGYFRVIDQKGDDISKEFSPLLKQLFLLIFLNTIKSEGKGISSFHIKEILWFDKSRESAKNNMAVFLSKLRAIFKQVGHIEIKHKDSYWTIELGDGIFCDYKNALLLMKQLRENPKQNADNLRKLLSITSSGGILPNIQFDWLDSFKANFSNELIDLLIDYVKANKGISINESIEIADAIFIHDSLNEDALKLKCTALIKMGKNGLAKGTYTQFSKEYLTSLGIQFNQTFEQIISDN